MANQQNLDPHKYTAGATLARINGAKGGHAKAKKMKEEEEAQRVARAILFQTLQSDKGGSVRVVDALIQQVAVAAQKALKKENPDPKCAEFLLKVAGMMPSEKRETTLKGGDEPIRLEPQVPKLTPEQMLEVARMHQAKK